MLKTDYVAMRLRAYASFIIIFGLIVTSIISRTADDIIDILSMTAYFFGFVLLIAFLVELKAGFRNLVRTDIFMLIVLYGLTFTEFLFNQNDINIRVGVESIWNSIDVVLCAFGGLTIGRHFFRIKSQTQFSHTTVDFSPVQLFRFFIFCTFVGYLHVLIAVNFDIFEALRQMGLPRFAQSWTRGRLGGASALLNELGLLIFLIPPLAAAILAEKQRYSTSKIFIVVAVLIFTFYFGFSGGTRYIFLTYLIMFCVSYLMIKGNFSFSTLIAIGLPAATAAATAMYLMVYLRRYGLSNWSTSLEKADRVFLDMNIFNIAGIIETFPYKYQYIGLEIPYIAIIRPIPRVLWRGKPEGLSISIEEVLGADGWTLSATYIGEFYMAGGLFAVILASFIMGAAGSAWNLMGTVGSSKLDRILFASGFFAAGLCMRSFLSVVPAILPTVALYVYRRNYARRQIYK